MTAKFSGLLMKTIQNISFIRTLISFCWSSRVIEVNPDALFWLLDLNLSLDSEERSGLRGLFHIVAEKLIKVLNRSLGQNFLLAVGPGFPYSPVSIHIQNYYQLYRLYNICITIYLRIKFDKRFQKFFILYIFSKTSLLEQLMIEVTLKMRYVLENYKQVTAFSCCQKFLFFQKQIYMICQYYRSYFQKNTHIQQIIAFPSERPPLINIISYLILLFPSFDYNFKREHYLSSFSIAKYQYIAQKNDSYFGKNVVITNQYAVHHRFRPNNPNPILTDFMKMKLIGSIRIVAYSFIQLKESPISKCKSYAYHQQQKIYQIFQPTIQTDIPMPFVICPNTKLIYILQIMKGRLSNLYCNMNLEHSIFSYECNSDSSILFVAGTPEQVNIKIANLLKVSSLSEYTALRVQIKGRVLKQQNTCCLMSTIFASAALLLPIFCVCTQWWRRKALKLLQIGQPTYQLISDLLKHNNFQECYILLEDNFLDRDKLQTLAQGLRHGVSNFILINKASKFNISGSNSSNFQANIQPILHNIKYVQIRWEKTVFTNSQIIPRGL